MAWDDLDVSRPNGFMKTTPDDNRLITLHTGVHASSVLLIMYAAIPWSNSEAIRLGTR